MRQGESYKTNLGMAHKLWGKLPRRSKQALRELSERYGFSLPAGDLKLLSGAWYVTHAGLLRLANRRRCTGITTTVQERLSDAVNGRWVIRATVYRSAGSKGFTGYGDADPSNVSPLVRGAELRIAETRAVNRALRKAYGIGLCSVEELKYMAGSLDTSDKGPRNHATPVSESSGNGQPRLRDRLCVLIRQHRLDSSLVKCYAAAFCQTENLRDASREQVQAFIQHLGEWAERDREGLLCKLNSYAAPEEVTA